MSVQICVARNGRQCDGADVPRPVLHQMLPLKADGVLQAAPMITDAQRRETLLDLMEASLRPKSAAPDLGMDLVEPMRPSPKQEACLPPSSGHEDQCIGSYIP